MKKFFSAAASALLALAVGLPCAAPVKAAAPCEFTLSSVTVPARAKSVSLSLTMKSTTEVAGADFVIDLPEGVSLQSSTKKLQNVSVAQMGNGDLRVTIYGSSETLSGDVTLCDLVFDLPNDKVAGNSFEIGLLISSGDVFDYYMDNIDAEVHSAVISVDGSVMYGDANGDCTVNAKDITAIMRRLTGADIDIDLEASDVNLDEQLDARDITQIMRYLTGMATVRLGHKDVMETIEEATCQKKGTARLTCVICNDSKTVVTPLALHDYVGGKCTMCGQKHRDYPIIAYAEYLRNNGKLESSLRGFALYETFGLTDYSLFSSNICDSKTGQLVIFGVGTFKSSLSCSVSIEMSSIDRSYKFTYYANYDDKQIAKAEGTVESNLSVSFKDFSGSTDPKVKESHLQIAQSIVKNCIAHTDKLMKASGLGVSVADLGLQVK